MRSYSKNKIGEEKIQFISQYVKIYSGFIRTFRFRIILVLNNRYISSIYYSLFKILKHYYSPFNLVIFE